MIKNAKMNDFDGFVTEDECTKLLKKSILLREFWIKIDYTHCNNTSINTNKMRK